MIGRRVSVEELLQEVLRDESFYKSSGGGVTLSGGEPTQQLAFATAFAKECQAHSISVGLQTCGVFRWEPFEPHLGLFDFIHFDLKLLDPQRHHEATGATNQTILANAQRLVEVNAPLFFRMPVVPGHNDDDENIDAVVDFLGQHRVSTIHLLRYHRFGEAKLPRIGSHREPLGIGAEQADESFERVEQRLRSAGVEVHQ